MRLHPYGLIKKSLAALGILSCLVVSGLAAATTTNDVAAVANLGITQAKGIGQIMTIIAYVAGISLCIAGILQFKAHKDNPQQTPLSKPITLLCVGGGLLFLPVITNLAGGSLFGGTGNSGNQADILFKNTTGGTGG
ncbi:MAG: type IV secretion protein IcmD [Gammaproteobacteria bacterium]